MAPYINDPAQPKLPAVKSLPFHPACGNHTSILISESLLGFNVAARRQKAGFGPLLMLPAMFMPGRLKTPCAACGIRYSPAPTGSAIVIVAAGNASFARALQSATGASAPAAKAGSDDPKNAAAAPVIKANRRVSMLTSIATRAYPSDGAVSTCRHTSPRRIPTDR